MRDHNGNNRGDRRTRTMMMGQAAVLIALVCSGLAAGAPENLLINPGFEEGSNKPDGWTCVPPNPPGIDYIWAYGFAHGGARSVCVVGTGQAFGMWQQVVPVTPGAVYVLAGYVAFEDITPPGKCHLQLVFRNGGNQVIAWVDYPHHNGTREFALDFPPLLKVRAPDQAAVVEVNLFLQSPGRVWFDDVLFGLAPDGIIAGTVTAHGVPVEGARVFIWGDPWDRVVEDFTDAAGHYELHHVPAAFPRYVLLAEKPGYKVQPAGDVAIIEGGVAPVDFQLTPGPNPYDDLRGKCGRMELALWSDPPVIPDPAVIPPDPDGYPEHIRPYLWPDEYIQSDHPQVVELAHDILMSLPPPERTNAEAVAYAVYEWVSKHIEHDGVFSAFPGGLDQPYRDVTSGIWQTISGEGWCWGRSFYDWAYRPPEALDVRGTICVEHAWLDCALLRALNIPARAAIGAAQFWAQPPVGEGTWIGMSTTSGRTGYRVHGELGQGFATAPPPSFYPVANRPLLHEDWHAEKKILWREVHPWSESYPDTPEGLAQALADLAEFEETGEAPHGTPPPPGSNRFQIHYSDITLNLFNIGHQRFVDVRFPLPSASDTHIPLEYLAAWTNHPECVVGIWLEEVTNPPVQGEEVWFHIEFDLAALRGLGDLNCDGALSFKDINPFVLALTDPVQYVAAYPECDLTRADVSGDGQVDFGDVNPFVALLTAP